MCTIIALKDVMPGLPLVVAANRDELYGRQATAPRVLSAAPRVVGGQDLLKGGTWMGLAETGLFVGLTNQRSYRGFDVGLRSRGEVPLSLLRLGTLERALDHLRGLDPSEYNEFNLMIGDAHRLLVAYSRRDADTVELQELGPGVHVLANDRMGSPDFPKADRAASLASRLPSDRWPAQRHALQEALADHDLPEPAAVPEPPPQSGFRHDLVRRLQALCIHTPFYGTRSATVLAVGESGVVSYHHADGAPCSTPFVDHTPLLTGRTGGVTTDRPGD